MRLHRPRLRTALAAVAAAIGLTVFAGTGASEPAASANHDPKPTVVLVHGAFADASGWSGVIAELHRERGLTQLTHSPLRESTMTENNPHATIVLIHGLWLTPRSWEYWITRYTERGHQVLAPAWPGMEIEVEALRATPSVTDGLGLSAIADHCERIIRGLDEPPIIMGHSFGGALVQIMLSRGLGRAGVALHPAPVKGVYRLPVSALRSSFPVLRNPANRHKTVGLTYAQWRYAFTNTMSDQDSRAAYDRYHVPSTGRPLFQAAAANFLPNPATKVDFRRGDRAPLLLVSGGSDHVVPQAMVRENVKRYGKSGAITAYHEFPGRPHFTTGAPGWRDMADYVLNWAELKTTRSSHPEPVPESGVAEPRPRTP